MLIQQIESNLTIPLVMANRVKLHPALVAIGVVVIGQLFGFVGLFVAVPILSLIVILVDEAWVKPQEAERGVVDPRDEASADASGASRILITFAGTPATTAFAGTSLVTTRVGAEHRVVAHRSPRAARPRRSRSSTLEPTLTGFM